MDRTEDEKMKKMTREELRERLIKLDEPDLDIRKDVYFEFKNPHNLIFTVYFTKANGSLSDKDFSDPTKAFRFWLNKPMRRNSSSFISIRPQHGDSFPYNFKVFGDSWHIALEYLKYLEKTEEWVRFLEESHPEEL